MLLIFLRCFLFLFFSRPIKISKESCERSEISTLMYLVSLAESTSFTCSFVNTDINKLF